MRNSAGLGVALLLAGCAAEVGLPLDRGDTVKLVASPLVTPAVGAIASYRVINAYSGDALGEIRYQVDQVGGGLVIVTASANFRYAGYPHTEIYTAEGNWLRHPVVNHDYPADYLFAPAYPAYPFPLNPGKSWSVRVNATNIANGRMSGMRVYGSVAGGERVSTPAGTFDTIKIVRTAYAGDPGIFVSQTVISEMEWYAPALGRAVRVERRSHWYDPGRAGRRAEAERGDWTVYELVRYALAAR